MPNSTTLTKENILEELQKGFNEVTTTVAPTTDSAFFKRSDSKWSVAENLEHLILSTKPLNLAIQLPKFMLLIFGKPNRPIRTYDELVKKYWAKLNAGGRAPSPFVPNVKQSDKTRLLNSFIKENKKFINNLNGWSEADLDSYLLPHPLLGKIYVREMLYFTIYHTQHHLRAIENCVMIKPAN
jgi:hypothetical protein